MSAFHLCSLHLHLRLLRRSLSRNAPACCLGISCTSSARNSSLSVPPSTHWSLLFLAIVNMPTRNLIQRRLSKRMRQTPFPSTHYPTGWDSACLDSHHQHRHKQCFDSIKLASLETRQEAAGQGICFRQTKALMACQSSRVSECLRMDI